MSHSDYQAYNFHEWSSKSKTNDCNTKYRRNGRQHVWQGHLLSNKQLCYWCITLKFWFALRSQASFRAKLNIWGWQKTDKVINLEKTWSVYGTDRSFKLLLTYNLRNKCLYSLDIFNMIKQQNYLDWIIDTREWKSLRTSEGFKRDIEFAMTCKRDLDLGSKGQVQNS